MSARPRIVHRTVKITAMYISRDGGVWRSKLQKFEDECHKGHTKITQCTDVGRLSALSRTIPPLLYFHSPGGLKLPHRLPQNCSFKPPGEWKVSCIFTSAENTAIKVISSFTWNNNSFANILVLNYKSCLPALTVKYVIHVLKATICTK